MERRGPAVHESFGNKRGRGEMIKAPIGLQELRRKIYIKAKAEPSWRLRHGFGWKRWSRAWLHAELGLFSSYRVRHAQLSPKAAPA